MTAKEIKDKNAALNWLLDENSKLQSELYFANNAAKQLVELILDGGQKLTIAQRALRIEFKKVSKRKARK